MYPDLSPRSKRRLSLRHIEVSHENMVNIKKLLANGCEKPPEHANRNFEEYICFDRNFVDFDMF